VEHAKETKIIAIKEDIFESQINPYLLNNLDKKLYIDELSEKFRITQRKLNAIIKKATGLTPKQYITKIKIEKAYNEIVLSNKDLQDISSDIGIEDYNYFIKLFKSIKGHTPKYFRKDS
jgi:YesN/AraC family two-component response regulator